MADGDIVTASFKIKTDTYGINDTAVVVQLAALFPTAEFDILTTQIIESTGSSGERTSRVLVVARDTT